MTRSAVQPAWHADAASTGASADALALFGQTFGGVPDGVWAAPGRVNLIGEHLDYNGGPVLPFALPELTVAAVRARTDDEIHLVSAADAQALHSAARWSGALAHVGPAGGPDAVSGWAGYVAGVLWALRQARHDVPGVDVAITSTVPLGAGLSSSAALECAVALGLADLLGLPTDDDGRAALAAACVRAENEVAGASTGGMDQAASLRCTAGHVLALETADGSVTQVPFDVHAAGLAVLVIDTRAPHRLVDGQYAARRAACEEAARTLGVAHLAELAGLADGRDGTDETDGTALAPLDDLGGAEHAAMLRRRVRHVVTETARARAAVDLLQRAAQQVVVAPGARSGSAADAPDLRELGPLLDASHASLREDYEVSCPELDTVTDAARAAGALGARMTGGGFGGSAIALVEADGVDGVRRAVRQASAAAGHPAPAFLVAVPSAGARRLA